MLTESKLKAGVQNYFDCSTGHITEIDNDILNKMSVNDSYLCESPTRPWVTQHEYGYWVHVMGEDIESPAGLDRNMEDNGLSAGFYAVMAVAKQHKCNFVKFDCDGFVFEDLVRYDW
jgi:hypothetical protein